MIIAFRVDASLDIGSGHVMRCLTLADSLKQQGHVSLFICRNHVAHMGAEIMSRGFELHMLANPVSSEERCDSQVDEYTNWLGTNWQKDANQTIAVLEAEREIDWLIVDHYALASEWEREVSRYIRHLMVIDDLANRNHICDVILDQNLVADYLSRYDWLVPRTCKKLLGLDYLLLQPAFYEYKQRVKVRKKAANLLVFFGGADKDNWTLKLLKSIEEKLARFNNVDVVVGTSNPHAAIIEGYCKDHRNCQFHQQVSNMAELLAKADLAIGAGGSVTWERIFLGLPAIVFTVADNQVEVAKYLHSLGYIYYLGDANSLESTGTLENKKTHKELLKYCTSASSVRKQSEKLLAIQYASTNKIVSQLAN